MSGELSYFSKPLLLTWLMFLAMAIAMPIYCIQTAIRKYRQHGSVRVVVDDYESITWRNLFLLIVPSCFDLAATALATAGLMYVTVSVYQVRHTGRVWSANLYRLMLVGLIMVFFLCSCVLS